MLMMSTSTAAVSAGELRKVPLRSAALMALERSYKLKKGNDKFTIGRFVLYAKAGAQFPRGRRIFKAKSGTFIRTVLTGMPSVNDIMFMLLHWLRRSGSQRTKHETLALSISRLPYQAHAKAVSRSQTHITERRVRLLRGSPSFLSGLHHRAAYPRAYLPMFGHGILEQRKDRANLC